MKELAKWAEEKVRKEREIEKLIELIEQSYYCDIVSLAEDLVSKGVTVQEWISVTERLPEESGEYLTYCGEYDGICVLHCEVLKTKSKWRTNYKEVTHWMPLPEPPKGE